jgi:dynein heavy chain, axonemal
LNDIVKLTRTEIDSLDRCTIEALIVLDVHNRDVVQSLAQRKIERITDFDWQAQLRYYWLENSCLVLKLKREYLINKIFRCV